MADKVRGVPVHRVGNRLVTTVLDLLLAHYGVARGAARHLADRLRRRGGGSHPGLGLGDHRRPGGADHPLGARVGAERDRHQGSRDDPAGAGTNHWFHSDQIYRAMLVLTSITGCQGRNGGGWAHYVGQEKVRPIMGFQHMAFALDWHRPPRHMNQTAYWYVNTSQYRYDTFDADDINGGTGFVQGSQHDGPARAVGAPGLGAVLPAVQQAA